MQTFKRVFPIRIDVIKEIMGDHVFAVFQSDECKLVVPFKLRTPDIAALRIDQPEELLNHRVRRTDTTPVTPGIGLLNHEKKTYG